MRKTTVTKPKPIAVFCSDLHLSLNPPACRKEKDWLEVQAGCLAELRMLTYGLPVFCAGDIFDKWNPMPELIHFALGHLPDGMICVPGNHDLPNHLISEKHRSAYGVLTEAQKIEDLSEKKFYCHPSYKLAVHGFGCGQEIIPLKEHFAEFHVALIHRYIWEGQHKFPGAPKEAHVFNLTKSVKDYDLVIAGDNHAPFLSTVKHPKILNSGTLIRRKSDEIGYTPCVGILYDDGTVKQHKLDTSKDQFHPASETLETALDVSGFVHELEQLGEHGLDFREAVQQHLKKEDVDPKVRQIILEALG